MQRLRFIIRGNAKFLIQGAKAAFLPAYGQLWRKWLSLYVRHSEKRQKKLPFHQQSDAWRAISRLRAQQKNR